MRTVDLEGPNPSLASLVAEAEQQGEAVHICRLGRPVAILRPLRANHDILRQDPRLKVIFHEDPSLPLTDEEWPEEFR
jgi:antitoxin (DNA-binding transcriptional repressor) of toxin-antitoxin stability system